MIKQLLVINVLLVSIAFGLPGDVLDTAMFENLRCTDMAFGANDTIWLLGTMDGRIYHVSSDLEILPEDTITHPIGAASPMPPFQPVCRGLAYDAGQSQLIVMNGNTFEIVRCSIADGSQQSEPLALQAPEGAALVGLSYDADSNALWSVDQEGDQVLSFNPDTGALLSSLPFPGNVPPETLLYGTGVFYLSSPIEDVLYILWGDIFQERADTVKRLSPVDGAPDPFSIPLSQCGPGMTQSLLATSAQLIVMLQDGSDLTLVKLDGARPFALPASEFSCTPSENGNMHLQWVNHGTGADNAYDAIAIRRNGATITQVSGHLTEYVDVDAPAGMLTYELQPSEDFLQVPPSLCERRNKRGAILSWIPFPGGNVSALAVDPETGNVWVADSRELPDNKYAIWQFSPDLVMLDSIEVTLPGAPAGLTFWPNSTVVEPPETILVISNVANNTVHRALLDGTMVGGGVPLRLDAVLTPDQTDAPKAASLAFDGDNGEYFLAVLDTTYQQITWVNENGHPPAEGNTEFRRMCKPPEISGIQPESGLARSQASGLFHVGIGNGSLHELSHACNVTTFDLNPDLPSGPMSGLVEDFDYSGNIVYISSPATQSIFKVLAYTLGNTFIRGDFNDDQAIDLADAIAILAYLFEENIAPVCEDAADANDDGRIDISDAVYLLFYQFNEGEMPPLPFPDAGPDPTLADDLTC